MPRPRSRSEWRRPIGLPYWQLPQQKTILAVVGALIAGVTVVPVPPDSGKAEREHILRDSGAQAWLGETDDHCEGLPVVPVRLHARSWHSYPEPAPQSTAFVLYTSGTTGPPKGVLLSRSAIAAGLDALAEAWDWTWRDTLVHGLPLFHVHGLILGILGPLRIGSRVIHTVKPTPENYARAKGSLYFGVPTVWSRIAEDEEAARALSGARLLVSGSAPLPVPVFEKLRERTGLTPIERYGMSETMLTLSTRFDGERRPGWVGVPLRGVETRLRDEKGNDVPHDGESIGGLQVRGPMLFDGYLNRPDATAESWTEDGYFKTGGRRRHRRGWVPPNRRPRIHRLDQIRWIQSRRRRDRDRHPRAPFGVRSCGDRCPRRRSGATDHRRRSP